MRSLPLLTLVSVLIVTLAGCPAPTRVEVRVLGTLTGPLADAVPAVLQTTPFDAETADQPVLLAGDVVHALTATEAQALASTLDNFHPVVLLDATREDIRALGALLAAWTTTPAPFNAHMQNVDLPQDAGAVEAYAVDLEPGGHVAEWMQHPLGEHARPLDAPERQRQRARALADWLAENQHRLPPTARQNGDGADPPQLTGLTPAAVDTQHWQTSDWNQVTVTHTVWACHDTGTGDDLFLVRQDWTYQMTAAYYGRHFTSGRWGINTTAIGWYLGRTEVDLAPVTAGPTANVIEDVSVPASAPGTTYNDPALDGVVSYTVDGTVLVTDAGGVTQRVDGGVVLGIPEATFDASGCHVDDTIGGAGWPRGWLYTFDDPPNITPLLNNAGEPPLPSRTQFTPTQSWVYRVPNRPDGGAAIRYSSTPSVRLVKAGWSRPEWQSYAYRPQTGTVHLVFPPDTGDGNADAGTGTN